jgi:hypothetical protein
VVKVIAVPMSKDLYFVAAVRALKLLVTIEQNKFAVPSSNAL